MDFCGIEYFFLATLILMPLGLWKLVETVWWLICHVRDYLMTRDAIRKRNLSLCRQLCKLMGWPQKTVHKYTAIRKFAMDEAVVVGLDKLEEIVRRLETKPGGEG